MPTCRNVFHEVLRHRIFGGRLTPRVQAAQHRIPLSAEPGLAGVEIPQPCVEPGGVFRPYMLYRGSGVLGQGWGSV